MAELKLQDNTEALHNIAESSGIGKQNILLGALLHILGVILILIDYILPASFTASHFGIAMWLVLTVAGTTLMLLGAAAVGVGVIRMASVSALAHLFSVTQEQNRQIIEALNTLNDRILLSETSKRIAYRAEDLETLRAAIKDDIKTQRFDAALALLAEMGSTFGANEEAEMLREEIGKARAVEMEQKVSRAFETFEAFLVQAEWDKAASEANKIKRLYPDHLKTKDLGKHILEAKEQHKRDLERQFLQAAERDEVEKAEALLKELDKYLSPNEAEPFRETARAVFGKKKQNLGVQFKLALSDKEYAQAIRVGQQIIREFPNSRMAEEVRGHLDRLRELVAQEKAATSPNG